MGCLSGAVGRRARIQPKARNTQWLVTATLWVVLIACSGLRKTSLLRQIKEPLRKIEACWYDDYQSEQKEYALRKEVFDIRLQAWKQLSTSATKKSQDLPQRPEEEPAAPVCRRLIVNDATPEKLQEILSGNPAGVLLFRDELMGLLSGLEKQGRETERQFLLECWNGDGEFKIDRIGRGTILAKHLCVSILGGIQPGRYQTYINQAIEGGQGDDGLMQRFQVAVYPDPPDPKTIRYVDEFPNASAIAEAEKMYRRLTAMNPDEPRTYRFDEDAQELFSEWLPELDRRVLSGELHPALASHLSKYRSLMPSIALLLKLADSDSGAVSLRYAQQAAAWCDYLESHARRIYSIVISPERRAAVELGRHLHKEGWKREQGSFTVREVYHKDWSGLTSSDRVRAALSILQDAGWVRPADGESGRGRPSEVFLINPKIYRRAK